jgi:hypothetical protein
VFPIAHDHATTVRLYIRRTRVDGEPVRRDWMSEDPTPRVPLDAQTALYAGPIVRLPDPERPVHHHVALVPEPNLERLRDPVTRRRVERERHARPPVLLARSVD